MTAQRRASVLCATADNQQQCCRDLWSKHRCGTPVCKLRCRHLIVLLRGSLRSTAPQLSGPSQPFNRHGTWHRFAPHPFTPCHVAPAVQHQASHAARVNVARMVHACAVQRCSPGDMCPDARGSKEGGPIMTGGPMEDLPGEGARGGSWP
jgi:hypothetical protein